MHFITLHTKQHLQRKKFIFMCFNLLENVISQVTTNIMDVTCLANSSQKSQENIQHLSGSLYIRSTGCS